MCCASIHKCIITWWLVPTFNACHYNQRGWLALYVGLSKNTHTHFSINSCSQCLTKKSGHVFFFHLNKLATTISQCATFVHLWQHNLLIFDVVVYSAHGVRCGIHTNIIIRTSLRLSLLLYKPFSYHFQYYSQIIADDSFTCMLWSISTMSPNHGHNTYKQTQYKGYF